MTNFTPGRTRIAQFRLAAQEVAPYMGQYVHSLIPIERAGIGTMAVDRHGRLYFDPSYVSSIDTDCGVFSILHEALHVVFDHASMAERIVGKSGTPDQYKAWNFAVDMVVNGILREFVRHAPEGIITAERFGLPPKLTAVEYYHLLMNAVEQSKQQESSNDSERDGDESDDDSGDGTDDGDDGESGSSSSQEDGEDDASDDEEGGDPTEGDGTDEEGTPNDEGRDQEASGDQADPGGDEDGEVTDHKGGGGSCSDGKPRDYELPADDSWEDREFAMATDLENKCESLGWGNVPGAIRKALGAKLRPQPDPFDVLKAACARAVSSPVGSPDYTYRRLSRRQVDGQPRLKGVVKLTPNAVIVLDTSGSMLDSETEAKALTVVASGLRRLRSIKVIGGDTAVTSCKQVNNLKQLDWCGGGGTSMKRVLETVDAEHRPDAIVLITDGYTDWPERLRARLVVALTQPTRAPEWATAIYVGKEVEA